MSSPRHDSAVTSILTAIGDLLQKPVPVAGLDSWDRIDGKNCLITGANSGLGKAIAIGLAARGGNVVMACRKDYPKALTEVRRHSANGMVTMERIDLADLDSIRNYCDRLRDQGRTLDLVILNAGVVPNHARRTRQGFEEMFGVNYLANFLFITRLLQDGTIPNLTYAGQAQHHPLPRIIIVSSESHRTAPEIDFEQLGRFRDYGLTESLKEYGKSKLLLTTFAAELARKLVHKGKVDVSVHALCPGPVNTNISREAPWWVKPFTKLILVVFFRSPARAARPVLFLSCSPLIEGQTGLYLHMDSRKDISASAADPAAGKRLWECSQRLVQNGPIDVSARNN
jgi:NAD(P)-dependent dehydrogenase (short-subunit alcohol dehydrogenase family)